MHRWVLTGLVAIAAASVLAGIASFAPAYEPGAALFERRYVSTRVIKNGEPDPLVKGTRIRLKFAHETQHDVARWIAGCNRFGAPVNIEPKRLSIGAIGQTEMKCADPIMRQEAWVARFFGSDPRWHRTGGKLRLQSGDDVIKLRRRT
jgi:heat shock protein HslJ